MSNMDYESQTRDYEDEPNGYDRDRERSRSPRDERRDERRDDSAARNRSASPNGRAPMNGGPPPDRRAPEDEGARNPGSNLFVTGIHPSLTEEAVTRLFEKYGDVEKTNIMRDPHSGDSRGFGFVKMVTPEQAEAAREGLQGVVHEGRTLSIEKARRARPRSPTPGKYYGPPKRDDFRGGSRGGDRYGDRSFDRRGGYGGRRDDHYSSGYRSRGDRYDDRGSGRRDRDRYDSRPVDRYASSGREDRYGSSRGDDRRGDGGYYDSGRTGGASHGEIPFRADRDPYGGDRSYNYDRRDERH